MCHQSSLALFVFRLMNAGNVCQAEDVGKLWDAGTPRLVEADERCVIEQRAREALYALRSLFQKSRMERTHIMSEHTHAKNHVHAGAAVLDIGEDVGALLIYCPPYLCGQQIDVSPCERLWERIHTDVLERQAHGKPVFAALFLALAAGPYVIWGQHAMPAGEVIITGGRVSELNWQEAPQLASVAESLQDAAT